MISPEFVGTACAVDGDFSVDLPPAACAAKIVASRGTCSGDATVVSAVGDRGRGGDGRTTWWLLVNPARSGPWVRSLRTPPWRASSTTTAHSINTAQENFRTVGAPMPDGGGWGGVGVWGGYLASFLSRDEQGQGHGTARDIIQRAATSSSSLAGPSTTSRQFPTSLLDARMQMSAHPPPASRAFRRPFLLSLPRVPRSSAASLFSSFLSRGG